jgi:hypothetical protein
MNQSDQNVIARRDPVAALIFYMVCSAISHIPSPAGVITMTGTPASI